MTAQNNPFGKEVSSLLKDWKHTFSHAKNALDAGCAHGSNAKFLASFDIQVDAVDIKLPPHDSTLRIKYIQSDILTFSFEKKYDVILALNVLQFLTAKDKYKVMDNFLKSLSQNGMIFISSFTQKDPSFNNSKNIQSHFAKEELRKWAQDNHLNIIAYEEKVVNDCHEPIGEHQHGLVSLVAQKIKVRS